MSKIYSLYLRLGIIRYGTNIFNTNDLTEIPREKDLAVLLGESLSISDAIPPQIRSLVAPKETSTREGYSDNSFLPVREGYRKDPDLMVFNTVAMDTRRPQFRNQTIIEKAGVHWLDNQNCVLIHYDVLSSAEIDNYLEKAAYIDRQSGPSAFNHMKPRREMCYTLDGTAFRYSRILHRTIPYPQHVIDLMPRCFAMVEKSLLEDPKKVVNPYTELSNGIDIVYCGEFPQGGSVSTHSDDEIHWGIVIIYNLGQTRWFRIKNKKSGEWTNVPLVHNSIVTMYGETFQADYTHQVDKLGKNDPIGTRLSLNFRYVRPKE